MKTKFAFIIALLIATVSFGQTDTLGFTSKAEANNLMVNGLKEGKWVEYFDTVKGLSRPTKNSKAVRYRLVIYEDGRLTGIQWMYWKDGTLYSRVRYEYGKANGVAKWYYENGAVKRECPYTNDLLDGIVKEYYEDGKLKSETTYVRDKKGAVRNYDENGNEIK
jgi:antitoxin component YwqK of YwqJK toxin-antitoxin module